MPIETFMPSKKVSLQEVLYNLKIHDIFLLYSKSHTILHIHFLSCSIFLFPKSVLRRKGTIHCGRRDRSETVYWQWNCILTVINLFLPKQGRNYTLSISFPLLSSHKYFPHSCLFLSLFFLFPIDWQGAECIETLLRCSKSPSNFWRPSCFESSSVWSPEDTQRLSLSKGWLGPGDLSLGGGFVTIGLNRSRPLNYDSQ